MHPLRAKHPPPPIAENQNLASPCAKLITFHCRIDRRARTLALPELPEPVLLLSVQLRVLPVELDGDVDIQVPMVIAIRRASQHARDLLALPDRQRILEVEDRLLPVCRYVLGAGRQRQRLVGGGEVAVEVADKGMDLNEKLFRSATGVRASRESARSSRSRRSPR